MILIAGKLGLAAALGCAIFLVTEAVGCGRAQARHRPGGLRHQYQGL